MKYIYWYSNNYFKIKSMRDRGEEVYHLAFGQSPFSIPRCFVDALKENAHINDYLPVAGTCSKTTISIFVT